MSTEFNSNINFGSIQKKSGIKPNEIKEEILEQAIDDNNEDIREYNVPVGQSAIAGKSQIKTDNISNDLLMLKTNPGIVHVADEVFDRAYEKLSASNDPEAYEKASVIANAFVHECCNK